MSYVEALLLNKNPMPDAALEFFKEAIKGGMREKNVTLQLQTVAVVYACQGVKRNGGLSDKTKREEAACAAFRDFAVPGLLKWLSTEVDPPFELPPWLTLHKMGSTTKTGQGETAINSIQHQLLRGRPPGFGLLC